ncbi:glycosyltransferase [Oligoflexus tunisiensis]|uniref:glycosyltransferase n=1 Tax=Oligoflexus tunisiensis TaxID=708132 RepID=UPI00114CC7A9|nr:glycosyltransferase [Oligoflexus tunisiensis]
MSQFNRHASEDKLLIMIPTYNERENVEPLIEQIQTYISDADLLFIDDNSSDGTGHLLECLKSKYTNLIVLHRAGKLGIGSAHDYGIRWAYENKYKRLVTMDCDFTHPPHYLPTLIAAGADADVVVGSRYLQEKSLQGWNIYRKSLTMLGHFLTKRLLGMPYDATGAFRYYRLDRIPSYLWDSVVSKGYAFFFESLYVIFLNQFKIREISINLPARTYGHSKMTRVEAMRSVKILIALFLTTLLNRERLNIVEPLDTEMIDSSKIDSQGWEEYWDSQYRMGRLIYDAIAAFYRKFIIKPTLNHFIKKHFTPKTNILHAGCGSGQVDTDIREYVKITGLDISREALRFYKRTNQDRCKILHGSIFEIPLPSDSVDGIYNLGVMEHFTEEEIQKILKEFHRVLRPQGRMVIFWPPEFGLSVLFFKALTLFFMKVLRKKQVKFHPDEITRVRSKAHVKSLFESANFRVKEYYFGVRDVFTYSIISVEK